MSREATKLVWDLKNEAINLIYSPSSGTVFFIEALRRLDEYITRLEETR